MCETQKTMRKTALTGCFARSLAGHDKGRWYVIVAVHEKGIFVADGSLKTVEKPKRKNPKHLQICRRQGAENGGGVDRPFQNEQIKYMLRQFCLSQKEDRQRKAELEDIYVEG